MDEISMFAAVRPAEPVDEEAILTTARARLTHGARLAVAAPAGRPQPIGASLRRMPLRRSTAVAATVLAAAAVVVTQTVNLREGSLTAPPPANAATELERAAEAADTAPGPQSQRGDYVLKFVVYRRLSQTDPRLRRECVAEWGRVGSDMLYLAPGQDRCTDPIPVRPPAVLAGREYAPQRTVPVHPSTDPRTLLDQIYRGIDAQWHGSPIVQLMWGGPNGIAFVTLSHLVEANTALPTRSTVFRAMALIPGITLEPDVTDALGRHGVGISYRFGDGRRLPARQFTIILNRTTYQYLGFREIRYAGNGKPERSTYSTALQRLVIYPSTALPPHR